jgi:hypothetical protein
MNIMATVPEQSARAIAIRQPRPVHCKIAAKKSRIKRFRHFIESTDWEERYLCHPWIDKLCLGGVIASVIYFFPLLLSVIQE